MVCARPPGLNLLRVRARTIQDRVWCAATCSCCLQVLPGLGKLPEFCAGLLRSAETLHHCMA